MYISRPKLSPVIDCARWLVTSQSLSTVLLCPSVEWVCYTHTHLAHIGKGATSSSGTAKSRSLAASAADNQSYQGNRVTVVSFPLWGVGINESCLLGWKMIEHRFCGMWKQFYFIFLNQYGPRGWEEKKKKKLYISIYIWMVNWLAPD